MALVLVADPVIEDVPPQPAAPSANAPTTAMCSADRTFSIAAATSREIEATQPIPDQRSPGGDQGSYAAFSQTETCSLLSLVKGSRFQSLQRSRKVIPASRAIRSSSDGHT